MGKETQEKDKKTDNPFGAFDALKMDPKSSPFGDGLEMVFEDEQTPIVETPKKEEKPKKDETKETKTKEPPKTEGIEKPKADKKDSKVSTTTKVENENTEETEEEEEQEEVEEETEEAPEENNLQIFYTYLSDEGLVVPLEEGKKVESEDDLKSVIQNTINTGIEQYKNSHPEDVQKFIEFVDNGGDPRMFHKLYYEQRSWKDIDPSKEANQELVIREAYALAGWDEEDIDAEIQDKKDLGKLGPLAEKLHKKLIASEDENKQSLIEAQKEYHKAQQERANKEWDEFKDNLYKKEELNGFKLTKKLKDDLWDYITKPDKKSGKTKLQLHNETNRDSQFLYAYLAMNNWDMSKLEKQVKSKVTSEFAAKLKNATDSRNKVSKGSSDGFRDKKSDGKNPFSAFKVALDNNLI